MINDDVKKVEASLKELNAVKYRQMPTRWRLATWLDTITPVLRRIEKLRAEAGAKWLKKYKARLNGEDKDTISDLPPGTPEYLNFLEDYNTLMALPAEVKLQKIKQSWLEDYDEEGPQPSISALGGILKHVELDQVDDDPKDGNK